MSFEIVMPEMGEGVIEGTIATWLKQVGDMVEEYEPILEIETDKVTTEVVAEAEGVLSAILAQEGETVQVGQVLGVIGEYSEGQASHSAGQPSSQSASQPVSLAPCTSPLAPHPSITTCELLHKLA